MSILSALKARLAEGKRRRALPKFSYHNHDSPYCYLPDKQGRFIKHNWIGRNRELAPVAGYSSTGQSRPMPEEDLAGINLRLIAEGGVPHTLRRQPYEFMRWHSHETPADDGGIQHDHRR